MNEAKDYDFVVVGATEQSIINQFFNPSIPEALAEKCQTPFVMVKAASGIRSWVKCGYKRIYISGTNLIIPLNINDPRKIGGSFLAVTIFRLIC